MKNQENLHTITSETELETALTTLIGQFSQNILARSNDSTVFFNQGKSFLSLANFAKTALPYSNKRITIIFLCNKLAIVALGEAFIHSSKREEFCESAMLLNTLLEKGRIPGYLSCDEKMIIAVARNTETIDTTLRNCIEKKLSIMKDDTMRTQQKMTIINKKRPILPSFTCTDFFPICLAVCLAVILPTTVLTFVFVSAGFAALLPPLVNIFLLALCTTIGIHWIQPLSIHFSEQRRKAIDEKVKSQKENIKIDAPQFPVTSKQPIPSNILSREKAAPQNTAAAPDDNAAPNDNAAPEATINSKER